MEKPNNMIMEVRKNVNASVIHTDFKISIGQMLQKNKTLSSNDPTNDLCFCIGIMGWTRDFTMVESKLEEICQIRNLNE